MSAFQNIPLQQYPHVGIQAHPNANNVTHIGQVAAPPNAHIGHTQGQPNAPTTHQAPAHTHPAPQITTTNPTVTPSPQNTIPPFHWRDIFQIVALVTFWLAAAGFGVTTGYSVEGNKLTKKGNDFAEKANELSNLTLTYQFCSDKNLDQSPRCQEVNRILLASTAPPRTLEKRDTPLIDALHVERDDFMQASAFWIQCNLDSLKMFRDDFYRVQQQPRLITRQSTPRVSSEAKNFWKSAISTEDVLQQELGIVAALQAARTRTKESKRTSAVFNSRAGTEMTLRALETVQESLLDFIQHVDDLMYESFPANLELQPMCSNTSSCRVDDFSDFMALLEKPLFYAPSVKAFHQIGYSNPGTCDHHCYLSTWKAHTLLRSWVNMFHLLQTKRPDIDSDFNEPVIGDPFGLPPIGTRLLDAITGFGATELSLVVFALCAASTSSYWDMFYSPIALFIRLMLEKQQNSPLGIVDLVYSINNILLASSLSYIIITATSSRHGETRKSLLWISDRIIPFILPLLVLSGYWNEVVFDMYGFQPGFFCTAVWILLRGLELYPVYEVVINDLLPLIDDIVNVMVRRYLHNQSTSFSASFKSHLAGRSNLSISFFIVTFGLAMYHAWGSLAPAIGLSFMFHFQDHQELRFWLPRWARQPRNDEEEESEALLPIAFTLMPIICYYSAITNMAEFRDVHQIACLAEEFSYLSYIEALKTVGLVKGPWV